MMSTLCNWGVLGPGFVATRAVIPAIQRSRNGRVKAIASRELTRAGKVAQQWGIERACGSYQELLDDPTIEAVYIALPNSLHHPWTLRAARAGKHVLCEKPLACSAREGEEMLAACQAAGVQLMEAAMYRFHPRVRRLKELIVGGELGAPRFLHSAFSFPFNNPQNYRNSPASGGGALLDVGCYCVNAVCWLSDAEPLDILVFTSYRETGEIDLDTSALLRFPGGVLGHIQCSFAAAEHQSLEIVGSEGAVTAPQTFTAWRDDATLLRIQLGTQVREELFRPADPYQLMVEHFVETLRGEALPCYTPLEALRTLRALDAIREKSASVIV
jgi:xylose dehydrogenase (NAD/NADP)